MDSQNILLGLMLGLIALVGSFFIYSNETIFSHVQEPAHGVAIEKFNNIEEKVYENNLILKSLTNGDNLKP